MSATYVNSANELFYYQYGNVWKKNSPICLVGIQAKQKCSQTETVSARQVDKPKGPRAISSRLLRPTHSSQMRATGTTNMNIDKDGSGRPLTSEQIAYIEVWCLYSHIK